MHCLGGNTTDPIWRALASSDGISSWTPLKPQHSNLNPNPNTLANQLWCIDFLTPPTPLIIPYRLSAFLESLMPLIDQHKTDFLSGDISELSSLCVFIAIQRHNSFTFFITSWIITSSLKVERPVLGSLPWARTIRLTIYDTPSIYDMLPQLNLTQGAPHSTICQFHKVSLIENMKSALPEGYSRFSSSKVSCVVHTGPVNIIIINLIIGLTFFQNNEGIVPSVSFQLTLPSIGSLPHWAYSRQFSNVVQGISFWYWEKKIGFSCFIYLLAYQFPMGFSCQNLIDF